MSKHNSLTNDLIASLNDACAKLRDGGKCGFERECYFIGWCSDAWAACGVGGNTISETSKDYRQEVKR